MIPIFEIKNCPFSSLTNNSSIICFLACSSVKSIVYGIPEILKIWLLMGSPAGKESTCHVGDLGSIPGLGRFLGEGKGYPLQYSGLENSMDYIIHGVERVGHNWTTFTFTLNGLVVFPTFFNLSLNLAIRSSWSEPQSAPSLDLLTVKNFSIFGWKEYNQSDFGVDHLVMSLCRVFSCVVGRGCLLWRVFSWPNSVSLCSASFCIPRPNLPVTLHISWLPILVSFRRRKDFFLF